MNKKKLHQEILHWYEKEKRDLPWRKSLDPYRIWISEIMLQQTRVEAVIPYYERFISNFPSVEDLANADLDKLLNLWAGLGYYSRARNLKIAATQILHNHAGEFPKNISDLRTLKGIGPYTAAAIASISYGAPVAAIDGNLERVFSRLLGSKENPKKEGKKNIEDFGNELARIGSAGSINQAIMDLSSKICLPKEPKCPKCPLSSFCEGFKNGIQKEIPIKKEKKPPEKLFAQGIILVNKERILLARRPKGEWLAGLWDIPWWIQKDNSAPDARKKFGTLIRDCAQIRTITKYKIHFHVCAVESNLNINDKMLYKIPAPADEYRWVALSDLHGWNLPRPSEKALALTLEGLQ